MTTRLLPPLLLTALTVFAQPETNTVSTATELQQIVVTAAAISKYRPETTYGATFTDTPSERVPVTVDVLTEDFIRDRNVKDLDQLLSYEPGVSTGGRTMMSRTAGQYTVRGMPGNEVYLNGVVPASLATGVWMDPNVLDRIEVVKGAMGGGFGGQTVSIPGGYGAGGMVVLKTKRAELDDNFGRLESRTSVGKHLWGERIIGDWNRHNESGKVAIRLPFALASEQTFWAPSDAKPGQSFTFAPSVTFRPSEELTFGVDTLMQYSDRPAYQGISLKDGQPNQAFGYHWDTDIAEATGLDLRDYFATFSVLPWIEYRPTEAWKIRSGGAFGWSHLKFNHFGPNSVGPTQTNPYEASYYDTIYRQYSGYVHSLYTLETGPVKQTIFVGGDYIGKDQQGRSTFQSVATPTLLDPDTITPTSAYLQKFGLILQDEIEWWRFTALAGLRGDYHISANHNHAETLSPRGGLTFRIFDWLIPFANVSLTRAPNYGYYRNSTDTSTELTSEWQAIQYEAGLRVSPVEKFWITASAFQIDQNNLASTVQNVTTEEGSVRSRGFEVNASGDLTEDWSLFAGYTWLDYENRQSGAHFDRFPPNTIALYTTYRARFLYDTVWGFGWRYKDSWLETVRGEMVPQGSNVKSFSAFDASLDIPLGETCALRLAIRNIFDKRYVESARNLQSFPGEPRTFELTLRYNF
ncbi:MAG: TonB-dependent siderophore receptor [Kiritimatiellia bacterium]